MIIETEHEAQKEHDYQNLKGLNSPPQISGSVRAEPQPKDLAKSLPVPCCSVKLHRRHWFEVFCLDLVLCHEAKPQWSQFWDPLSAKLGMACFLDFRCLFTKVPSGIIPTDGTGTSRNNESLRLFNSSGHCRSFELWTQPWTLLKRISWENDCTILPQSHWLLAIWANDYEFNILHHFTFTYCQMFNCYIPNDFAVTPISN